MKINFKFFKNLTFWNSLGLLAVYMKLGQFGGPKFDVVSQVLLFFGLIGTTGFLIKRIFFEEEGKW